MAEGLPGQPGGSEDPGREESLRQARALEEKALRLSGDAAAELWLHAAEIRRALNQRDEAARLLRRAFQQNPRDASVVSQALEVFELEEAWADVVDVLAAAVALEENRERRVGLMARRGEVLGVNLGRLAEARSMYKEAERLTQDAAVVEEIRAALGKLEGALSPTRQKAGARPVLAGGKEQLATPPRGVVARIQVREVREMSHPSARKSNPVENPKITKLLESAQRAKHRGRFEDARASIEQALAMDRWSEPAVRARHELLSAEGRVDDLIRILVAEADECPKRDLAQANLRHAARLMAEERGDIDKAIELYRRCTAFDGYDEAAVAEAVELALERRVWSVAQELFPEKSEAQRAEVLEQLAQAAEVTGDARAALRYRATAFEDRPDLQLFFDARVAWHRDASEPRQVEAAMLERLERLEGAEAKRALLTELALLRVSLDRPKDAALAWIRSTAFASSPEHADVVLDAVSRLAKEVQDRTLYARALEAVSMRAEVLPSSYLAMRLLELGRLRRDELVDLEGAEPVFAKAARLGARGAKEELEQLRSGWVPPSETSTPIEMPVHPPAETPVTTPLGLDDAMARAKADTAKVKPVGVTAPYEIGEDVPSDRWMVQGVLDGDVTEDAVVDPAASRRALPDRSMLDTDEVMPPELPPFVPGGRPTATDLGTETVTEDVPLDQLMVSSTITPRDEQPTDRPRPASPQKPHADPDEETLEAPVASLDAWLGALAEALDTERPATGGDWLAAGMAAIVEGRSLDAERCFRLALDASSGEAETVVARLIGEAWKDVHPYWANFCLVPVLERCTATEAASLCARIGRTFLELDEPWLAEAWWLAALEYAPHRGALAELVTAYEGREDLEALSGLVQSEALERSGLKDREVWLRTLWRSAEGLAASSLLIETAERAHALGLPIGAEWLLELGLEQGDEAAVIAGLERRLDSSVGEIDLLDAYFAASALVGWGRDREDASILIRQFKGDWADRVKRPWKIVLPAELPQPERPRAEWEGPLEADPALIEDLAVASRLLGVEPPTLFRLGKVGPIIAARTGRVGVEPRWFTALDRGTRRFHLGRAVLASVQAELATWLYAAPEEEDHAATFCLDQAGMLVCGDPSTALGQVQSGPRRRALTRFIVLELPKLAREAGIRLPLLAKERRRE